MMEKRDENENQNHEETCLNEQEIVKIKLNELEMNSNESAKNRLAINTNYSKRLKTALTSVNTPFKSPLISPVISVSCSDQNDSLERNEQNLQKESDQNLTKGSFPAPLSLPKRRMSSFKTPILSNSAKSGKLSLISPKLALLQAQTDLRTLKLVLKNSQEETLLENLIMKWQKVSRDALECLRDQIGEGLIGRRMRLDELCVTLKIDITSLGKYYNVEMDSFEDSPPVESKTIETDPSEAIQTNND